MAIFLGYDPGGDGRNGVAALRHGSLITDTVGGSDAVVRWFERQCEEDVPVGLGVDTILFWELGSGGWRAADRSLKARYPEVRSSVMSPNGLRGAMAIQGPLVAIALREHWHELVVTETHPKVAYFALSGKRYKWSRAAEMTHWLVRTSQVESADLADEHQWDAAFSALAVREGLAGTWRTDLVGLATDVICPVSDARYYWPEDIA